MLTLETIVIDRSLPKNKRRPVMSKIATTAVICMLILVSACSKHAEKTEDIRPVRAIVLSASSVDVNAEFPGEVRPRIESQLGFRVGGKIVSRKVDVGTVVKRGQVLMQLDPQDLSLAQAQAKAVLSAAESNRDLAKAELKRYQELRTKNFVAASVLDGKEVAYKAAQSNFDQAMAGYKNQLNQSAYTTLVADADGVVTGISAEVGQVVSAGTPVVRVAQTGEMDVVVGIPEDKVNTIRQMGVIKVRLWANPNEVLEGNLRELSPIADPATRTYTAKISLGKDVKDVKLGMTAYVSFSAKNPNALMKVPLTALFQQKNTSSMWIVENGKVKLVPVQVAGSSGESVLISGGVAPGQTVVTAGVNLLKVGQRVSILGAETASDQVKNDAATNSQSANAAGKGVTK